MRIIYNLFFLYCGLIILPEGQAADYRLAASAVGRYVTHSEGGVFQASQEYGNVVGASSAGDLILLLPYTWDGILEDQLRLNIGAFGGVIRLHWPLVSGNVVVEKAASLNGNVSWQVVDLPQVETNGVYEVAIPNEGPPAFFRLRLIE